MSNGTKLYFLMAVLAIIASGLFAWVTNANQAETHLMFLGWLLLLRTKGRDE